MDDRLALGTLGLKKEYIQSTSSLCSTQSHKVEQLSYTQFGYNTLTVRAHSSKFWIYAVNQKLTFDAMFLNPEYMNLGTKEWKSDWLMQKWVWFHLKVFAEDF